MAFPNRIDSFHVKSSRSFNPASRMRRAQAESRAEAEQTLRELAFVLQAVRTVRAALGGRDRSVFRMVD